MFRDEAVAAIDAVDRLDEAMTIVSARSAIALSAIGALVLLALAWAVFGTVPVTVTGEGVFVANGGTLRAVVFLPFASDRRVVAGMPARVSPLDVSAMSASAVLATVATVAPYPATAAQLRSALQNDALAAQFSPAALVREVVLRLQTTTTGAPAWSGGASPTPPTGGTPCTATVIVRDVHPIELLFSRGS